MSNSRTVSSIKNVGVITFIQIFGIIITFISRTVFVNILGNDYLSVQALLLNLIAILSFTELGLGNAIIYSLYRPIANGDTKK